MVFYIKLSKPEPLRTYNHRVSFMDNFPKVHVRHKSLQADHAGCALFHYSLYSSALVAMECYISFNDTLIKPAMAASLLSPVYEHKF